MKHRTPRTNFLSALWRAVKAFFLAPAAIAAANNGDVAKVLRLIEKGAIPDTKNEKHNTLLHLAVRKRSEKMIGVLLEKMVRMHNAASESKTDMANMLIETKADPENWFGQSPLHKAAASGSVEAVKALLKAKACPNAKDKNGDTPLHKAANSISTVHLLSDYAEVVRLLLEANADPRETNNNLKTPRDLARSRGCTKIAEILRSAGG
ncbi:MAG: ankyrin repeat domain-containing protein [Deltaproteobacteria bacterium]|nr:ankyrin repeat domain-containing protein [Deltaproteobacteria bacterium]